MSTLHVVALPHTQLTDKFSWCAYTQKTRRFATMMTEAGYQVFLYGNGPLADAKCQEYVQCTSHWQYGSAIPSFEGDHPGFFRFAGLATVEIRRRAERGDFLCLIGGNAQKPIADALPDLVPVEFGVGYEGVFADFRCFESFAWMHVVYGATMGAHAADGRFYDTVIPNSYDPAEFPAGDGSGDYLLYLGRLTERKGLAVAGEVAIASGLPLIVAGAGNAALVPAGASYVGVVEPARRAELLGRARALLAPTLYVEPFGGVAVEAQLCGTPAITTPWGAFTETVEHGRGGFRCHTLADFVDAVTEAPRLDREAIRARAQARYSTEVAAAAYDQWFARLAGLRRGGWYELEGR